jgi:hypothetical protein
MAKSSRYFLSANNNYAYLDLNYSDATLQGSEIILTGSSAVDDVVVGKGLKLDFSASADGADNIYIRGVLSDFNYAKLDNAQTLVLLANNTRIKLNSADNIIFNDGRISVANLIQQVSSNNEATPVAVSSISNQQGWQAGVNSDPSQTLTSGALTAYATDAAVVFVPSNKNQTLRGGSGVDAVYVAAGNQVDATDLADAEDIIHLSKAHSSYTPTVIGNILQLVDGEERVRVIKGDRLLFSNGGVSVANAISAVKANTWNTLALTPDSVAPTAPSSSFKDNGISTSDRITSDSRITVVGLEYGASWQYQVDASGTWVNGSGNQFLASVGSHSYQVRQLDRAGNTSVASDLVTLDYRVKTLGFVMNGPNVSGKAGKIVSRAGDVNGDGLADIAIAEPDSAYTIVNGAWSSSDSTRAGTGYVVFGKTSNTAIELSSLHSSNGSGFALRFRNFAYTAAFDISNAGDVNGDGLDDIIMGVQKDRSANEGYACVVFGKTNNTAIELSNIANGIGGFVIKSQSESQYSLYKVSAAGDVNGDGYGDLLMANIADVASRVGFAYVVFGKSTGTPVDPAGIASGSSSQGFVIHAESATNSKISSLTSIGDINGDGLADLMIGLPSAPSGERCYVVYGKSSPTAVELSAIAEGNGGFVLEGISSISERFGFSISNAGDVNGDGLTDLILGASTSDTETKDNVGVSYVVFGVAHPININMSDITEGSGGFVIHGENANDQSGFSVSAAGDVNGDGLADMILGAPYADPSEINGAGRGYVVFGKNNSSAVYLSDIANGNGGFAINGQSSGEQAGYSVSAAGDINGDGLADLIVGAPSSLPNSGSAYVIFGKTDTAPVNLSDVVANYGNATFSVNHVLDAMDNTWVGTSGNESTAAGAGNDTLTGNGGVDVLYGGAGNDVFVLNESNIAALSGAAALNKADIAGILYQLARVDGGSGIDTLRVSGGANLDLTSIKNVAAGALDGGSRISSIEKIDLATDSSANTLKLALNDVVDMAGMNLFNTGNDWDNETGTEFAAAVNKHQLVVQGTALDTLDIDTTQWATSSSVRNAGVIYDIWNHNTSATQLLVQQGVQVI